MTLHPDDEHSSKEPGSTRSGKAPLCHACGKHVLGFSVLRRDIRRDIPEPSQGSKRFDHRTYHPTCSDRIRRRAARLLRKRA